MLVAGDTLAQPAPSGSTGTPGLCQGRLPPTPASPGRAALSSTLPAATGQAVKVSHLHSNYTAPHGALDDA